MGGSQLEVVRVKFLVRVYSVDPGLGRGRTATERYPLGYNGSGYFSLTEFQRGSGFERARPELTDMDRAETTGRSIHRPLCDRGARVACARL